MIARTGHAFSEAMPTWSVRGAFIAPMPQTVRASSIIESRHSMRPHSPTLIAAVTTTPAPSSNLRSHLREDLLIKIEHNPAARMRPRPELVTCPSLNPEFIRADHIDNCRKSTEALKRVGSEQNDYCRAAARTAAPPRRYIDRSSKLT